MNLAALAARHCPFLTVCHELSMDSSQTRLRFTNVTPSSVLRGRLGVRDPQPSGNLRCTSKANMKSKSKDFDWLSSKGAVAAHELSSGSENYFISSEST